MLQSTCGLLDCHLCFRSPNLWKQCKNVRLKVKASSTLATIVAENGDYRPIVAVPVDKLSPFEATIVTVFGTPQNSIGTSQDFPFITLSLASFSLPWRETAPQVKYSYRGFTIIG